MSLDGSDEQRAGLHRSKLTGLVRRAFPDVEIVDQPTTFNTGAGLVIDDVAYVLIADHKVDPLGAALAWALQRNATTLELIVDEPGETLAARTAGLSYQARAWRAVGTELAPVDDVDLAPIGGADPDAPAYVALRETIRSSGCDVLVEHGVMLGEVLGLEVARVVTEVDGSLTTRVGVGLYDQEAHALMHASEMIEARLEQVVAEVRSHRNGDVAPHPLNRAARERWLRSLVLADPTLVGLSSASAIDPLKVRGGVREAQPVAAMGIANDERVLVVASSGVDLGLVSAAAGYLHRLDAPADRIVLLLPERDHHEIIGRQAGLLAAPADLVSIADPWRR